MGAGGGTDWLAELGGLSLEKKNVCLEAFLLHVVSVANEIEGDRKSGFL